MFGKIFHVFGYFSRKKEHGIKTVYLALTLLSLHWSLIVYVNSSFLGQFMTDASISFLFAIGALIGIFPFFFLSVFLRKLGNYKLTVLFTLLEITALLGMALSTSLFFVVFFFLLHYITVPLILFNLDVFLEKVIGSTEQKTGSIRGLYLTVLSLSGAVAPLISGYLIGDVNLSYTPAYIASAILLIPFLAIITLYFSSFNDPSYKLLNVQSIITTFTSDKTTRNIFFVQLLLQTFFIWTVIYIPLYLYRVASFSWTEIGYILFVGLLAYVLLEYPIGVIADKYIGEKEMMAFGFFLLAVALSWHAFLPAGIMFVWMIATFMSRAGAAFVEATSESYFFKHTQGDDADKISLFRMARPLAAILATVVGSIALVYVDFNLLFIIMGLFLVPGIFFTLLLQDTK